MKTNEIIHGDCLDVMRKFPDKSIDMILADLPYGTTQNSEDVPIDLDSLWMIYKRIIKRNGAIILTAQFPYTAELYMSNKKWFRYDLVWDKSLPSGFLNANRMPLRSHENILVFYGKLPTYNPQFWEGDPLHSKGTSYKDKDHVNRNYGKFDVTNDVRAGKTEKYPRSVLFFPKPHPSIVRHRTEKSLALFEWLIETYTNEEDVVLDNVIGSGTTAEACINTNRQFIGIEKSQKYFDIAVERLRNVVKLFA